MDANSEVQAFSAREYIEEQLRQDSDFREAMNRAQQLLQGLSQHSPEIAGKVDAQRQRLVDLGFPDQGEWIETLAYVCLIVQESPAGLAASEIETLANVWCDREKLRERIKSRLLTSSSAAPRECENGPSDDRARVFLWNGRQHSLTNRNWELCKAIWNRPGVTFAEVADEVWGEEKSTGTIKSQLARLNAQFANYGIPLEWIAVSEKFYLNGPVAN